MDIIYSLGIYVVEGEKKQAYKLYFRIIENGSAKNFKQEFDYYPTEWFEPFISEEEQLVLNFTSF